MTCVLVRSFAISLLAERTVALHWIPTSTDGENVEVFVQISGSGAGRALNREFARQESGRIFNKKARLEKQAGQ